MNTDGSGDLPNEFGHDFVSCAEKCYFICKICNLLVYISYDSVVKISYKNSLENKYKSGQQILNISCNEFIIQSIIE